MFPKIIFYVRVILFITTIFVFPVFSSESDSNQVFEAWIHNIYREDILNLTRTGVDIDGVWKNSARVFISASQLESLKEQGYLISVIPMSRKSGIGKGYPTHEELTEELKAIAAAHPEICKLCNIGESEYGRELWFMKISDNVDIEEDEPEFKYISTMHGDEPVGMMLCMNLIHLLTESYGTDSRITNLVNETEIWIMPLMNPDGYEMGIRYNARGTDLNRSFPDRVKDPYNTTEGRPIETQNVMNWTFSHSPVLGANLHGGALVAVYPYDSDSDETLLYSLTPDNELFVRLAMTYSSLNQPMAESMEFSNGIINGLRWYPLYGGIQDWNYVWIGCMEITIELYDEKYPSYSEIPAIWEDNRDAMLGYMEWSLRGVRGVITDRDTGAPLNAEVVVTNINHKVHTDPDVGDYHRILLPGIYDIRFSAEGYITHTEIGVAVDSGNTTRLDIMLSPIYPGDIDTDGFVNVRDAVLALQILTASASGASEALHQKGDVNGDGKIGFEEAIFVLQTASGLSVR